MRLDLVQVLRALAALMVVVHHIRHELGALGFPGDRIPALPWWAGVDIFFVISGFIIVHAAGEAYAEPGGPRRFLAHRLARVAPPYWAVTLLFLGVTLAAPGSLGAGNAADPAAIAASFLFWPAARPDGSLQPVYGLGWTLNYEMLFYVVFALGLRAGRGVAVLWSGAVLGGLVLAGVLVRFETPPLLFWSNPIVLEFLLGAALGIARCAGLRLSGPVRLGLAALGALGLALPGDGAVADLARPMLLGLPAACLVAAAALVEPRPPGAGLRPLSRLGDASYALYLIHPFALRAVRIGLGRLGLAPGAWGTAALMLGASVALAVVVYTVVERPLTRAARRLLDRALEKRVRGPAPTVPRRPEPN